MDWIQRTERGECMNKKLPEHTGLGDIVFTEPEEGTGDIMFYRPCLYRWSEKSQEEYEAENDRSHFGWCVYGANPIYGAMAWIVKEQQEEE